MSYRKLEVDGKKYEYVIGSKFIKIKAPGASHTVEIVGFLGLTAKEYSELSAKRCECCYGKSASPLLVITPGKIASYIRREKI